MTKARLGHGTEALKRRQPVRSGASRREERSQIGTFNIAIDVCVDGEKQEFAFKWTADAEQIRHLVDRIENMAVRADVTSQALVHGRRLCCHENGSGR
jgi:hypothetical protein